MGLKQIASYAILTLASSGCGIVASGLSKAPDALSTASAVSTGGVQTASSSAAPLQAFQNSFYSFARSNCIQCHGTSQAPLFAASDVNAAYGNAKPFADFSNPANSLIVQFAGNGHCGVSNCSGSAQSSAALNAVNIWAAAENSAAASGSGGSSGAGGSSSSGGSGGTGTGNTGGDDGESSGGTDLVAPSSKMMWVTAPVAIPSNLPAAGTKFAIMRWNLSSLTPANSNVAGDVFEVQIQLLTPTVYRITMPKFAAAKGAVNVTGIHVLVKKSTDSGIGSEYTLGTGWNAVNANVSATQLPNPLPTTSINVPVLSSDAIPMPVLSSKDMLAIGFDSLSTGTSTPTASGCKNLNGTNGFIANVKPQMQQICFGCHLQNGESSAFSRFPMVNNNDAQLCATSLKHVNLSNPSQSDLVLRPQGSGGHPNFSGTFNPTPFIQWINTE